MSLYLIFVFIFIIIVVVIFIFIILFLLGQHSSVVQEFREGLQVSVAVVIYHLRERRRGGRERRAGEERSRGVRDCGRKEERTWRE